MLLFAVLIAAVTAALPQISGETGYYTTCTRMVPDRHFPLSLPRVPQDYRCWRYYPSSEPRLKAYLRRREAERREQELQEAQARFQEMCGTEVNWNCRSKRCQSTKVSEKKKKKKVSDFQCHFFL
jgi:hypothetical protein